ncbi:site-2 protease family protein [Peribacillus frigoritolerans]|uniref:site-2 protease family protein n=1 Tax=Peribacillus frigoritolerans TaxID=450367 RepID=UPI0024165A41|nr:site-2 protease family protein [Peribacillus frigoritolerans]MDG4850502.1 site-2 protease family protein [Peribacillus frigoritolerans]
MYTVFVLGVGFISILLVILSLIYMVLEILGKGKEDGLSKVIQFSIAGMIVAAITGYLYSSPPLSWADAGLILKMTIIFILVISMHESGHYFAARWMGVSVTEFAVGVGPTLFKHHTKHTNYIFKLLPVKGHIRMNIAQEETLSLINKCFLYMAGILVNLTSFILGLTIFFVQQGKPIIESFVAVFLQMLAIIEKFYVFLATIGWSDIITPKNDLENSVGTYISLSHLAENFWLGFAILSLILGLLNTLPIPALDGGRVILAILTSLARAVHVPEKFIKMTFYTLLGSSVLILYGPTVINNLWSSSEKVGMSFVEYILWLGIGVTLLINIEIYISNRRNRINPTE